ncbi:MAG TPA: hypothetical protein VFM13_03530 [Gaiellaceae bacterium]|nr:hypothetical protein [Gaiellaceae bacterium]
MRPQAESAALTLDDGRVTVPEFGTGLRARLDVVGSRAAEPVELPAAEPVELSAAEPVELPVEPVERPVATPVELPTDPHVERPAAAPVELPTDAHFERPAPAPIEMPSDVHVEHAVAVRRDVSPELMMVSPEPQDLESVLAQLLAQRVRAARREPLGALLAEAGLIAEAEIDLALRTARRHGKRLGEVLTDLGLVTPADIVRFVAEQRGLPFVDVASLPVDHSAARLLPADYARRFRTLPIGFVRGLPVVALADPSDDEAIDGARSVLRAAEFVASPEEAILSQLARLYVRAV